MATLILSTVGTALGGPIGGAIGSIAGSFIDGGVFGSGGGSEGPRLKELDVQTSSYGSAIPSIFGKMRVAGTVIWATDLQEQKNKEGGGKGKPSTTTYSYSVSMAVAVSSKPVAEIGRIWADGNLLRGSAGDFKTQTSFRFYDGTGNQLVDPLIASDVGVDKCSAHRGLAYVVFEDLQLADFGNRIPQMTFEVIERDASVPVSDIFQVMSEDIVKGDVSTQIHGYVAEGGDMRAALKPLVDACPVSIFPRDDHLELAEWPAAAAAQQVLAVTSHNGRSLAQVKYSRNRANETPKSIIMRHYEPSRDYQLGVQQSQRAGPGFVDQAIDFPAALTAPAAKNFADAKLLDIQHAQSTFDGSFLFDGDALRPGMWFEGDQPMRIREVEHAKGYSICSGRDALNQYIPEYNEVGAGDHVGAADLSIGQTKIIAMDLPILGASNVDQPVVAIAAAGSASGWRAANLSLQQGANLIDLGGTASAAAMGYLVADMQSHSAELLDDANVMDVQLMHDGMIVPPAAGGVFALNAPAIWVNGEIIRYGLATDLGGNQYRLSALLRGRFATEQAIGGHPAGSDCVFLEEDRLRFIDPQLLSRGDNVMFEAIGIADEQPVSAALAVGGNALIPRAPVHGRLEFLGGGDRIFKWHRRPRVDYGWQEYVDQPIAEDSESYQFRLLVDGQSAFEETLASPQKPFSAAEWGAFGFASGANIMAEITQLGTHGISFILNVDA